MSDYNKIVITGRVGSVESGSIGDTPILKVSVACNESRRKGDGWEDDTSWFRCEIIGDSVSQAPQINKGDKVLVEGRVRIQNVKDKGTFVSVKYPRFTILQRSPNAQHDTDPAPAAEGEEIPF